ncbi:right-handed parallel beta-helix repeat-containing protein [Candidatus Zixiibacteriota bacterium]
MKRLVTVLVVYGLLSAGAAAQTIIPGGDISGDEIWTAAGSPYQVQGTVNIPWGTSLTVQSGVSVEFDQMAADAKGFLVHGDLNADDAYFDASIINVNNDWLMIEMYEGGKADLEDCVFSGPWPGFAHDNWAMKWFEDDADTVRISGSSFAGFTKAIVLGQNGKAVINGCDFFDNDVDIRLEWLGQVAARDCNFSNPQSYAFEIYDQSDAYIRQSLFNGQVNTTAILAADESLVSIHRCSFRGPYDTAIRVANGDPFVLILCSYFTGLTTAINNMTLSPVRATDNWWANGTGPTHPANPGGTGETIAGIVTYDPWYKVEPCDNLPDVNCDGSIDPLDVAFMVQFVFRGNNALCAHPACPNLDGDVNCDNAVDPLDVTYLVLYVYTANDALCLECP